MLPSIHLLLWSTHCCIPIIHQVWWNTWCLLACSLALELKGEDIDFCWSCCWVFDNPVLVSTFHLFSWQRRRVRPLGFRRLNASGIKVFFKECVEFFLFIQTLCILLVLILVLTLLHGPKVILAVECQIQPFQRPLQSLCTVPGWGLFFYSSASELAMDWWARMNILFFWILWGGFRYFIQILSLSSTSSVSVPAHCGTSGES